MKDKFYVANIKKLLKNEFNQLEKLCNFIKRMKQNIRSSLFISYLYAIIYDFSKNLK